MPGAFVSTDRIRSLFTEAMSQMYRTEVPQYGTLIELVGEVNAEVLAKDQELSERLRRAGELERIDVERHGAIRLGTAAELFTIRRTSGKLKFLAGSESGMNVFINDVPPEAAAARLREVATPGYAAR